MRLCSLFIITVKTMLQKGQKRNKVGKFDANINYILKAKTSYSL